MTKNDKEGGFISHITENPESKNISENNQDSNNKE